MSVEMTVAETGELITVGEMTARARRLSLAETGDVLKSKSARAERFLSSSSWQDIRITYVLSLPCIL